MTVRPLSIRDLDGASFGPFDGSTPIVVGRSEECAIRLTEPSVSRRHARFTSASGRWWVEDLGSRHGVALNGARIAARTPVIVSSGDALQMAGALLTLSDTPSVALAPAQTIGADDGSFGSERIELIEANARLELVLSATARLFAAVDESSLFDELLNITMESRGFDRALIVRPNRHEGESIIVACRPEAAPMMRSISKSFIRAAASGRAVRLGSEFGLDSAHSIVSSGVTRAVAIPIGVGEMPDFVLIADAATARGEEPLAIVHAACRIATLARDALRRSEAERRQAQFRDELSVARETQEQFMPAPTGRIHDLEWRIVSRPGLLVAGDIVSVSTAGNNTILLLGDVAGKGAGAGLIMGALQSHFEALLTSGIELTDAMSRTNDFLCARGTRHATIIALQIDSNGQLTTIDAGHGLLVRLSPGKAAEILTSEGGPPLGAFGGVPFETSPLALALGESIVLFTDGLVEQPHPDGSLLGMDRVLARLDERGDRCPVDTLVELLDETIGDGHAADDMTIAVVRRVG
ncbi:MAG: SpoIIE family protein phosphatase [Planctomycetota bacterium]|nr:SpoIIE family protein phosphatase [Planctomycetota bacterium]